VDVKSIFSQFGHPA